CLKREASGLSTYLYTEGVRVESYAAIYMDPSAEIVTALLASLLSGCAYIPLDPKYPRDRLRFMVEDADPACILAINLETAKELFPTSRVVDVQSARATIIDGPVTATRFVPPEHACYVIYTSGSTGKPKGVEIQHRAWVNFFHHMRDTLSL